MNGKDYGRMRKIKYAVVVLGRMGRGHIDEINAQLGTELSTEGDFETIGGFILTHLGRVWKISPHPGGPTTKNTARWMSC